MDHNNDVFQQVCTVSGGFAEVLTDERMDKRTNGQMDGRISKPSYRDAKGHLEFRNCWEELKNNEN